MNTFYKIISEVAKESGFKAHRVLDSVIEFRKGDKRVYTKGEDFGLNSSLSNKFASNKGQAYAILKLNDISAVPHFGLYNPEIYSEFGDQKKRNKIRVKAIIKRYGLPLVAKPAEGSSGKNVSLAFKRREIKNLERELFLRNDEIVLSPFRNIKHEYRVIVLGNKVELIFDKIRGEESDFRHNLCLGAKPELVSPNDKVYSKLEKLAKRTIKVLRLEFASVDIIKTEEFGLEVLEVNSVVSMSYFAAMSPGNYKLAKNIYKKAFKKFVK